MTILVHWYNGDNGGGGEEEEKRSWLCCCMLERVGSLTCLV